MTIRVGKWLARMGYLGAFGIDAIAYHDKIYLAEVNPRFQNSSVIAAQIDMGLDRTDIYLNHMTAFFGYTAPQQIPLQELVQAQPCISQITCYNRSPNNMLRSADNIHEQGYFKCMNLPKRDVSVVPGGMLFRGVINDLVTTDGYNIIPKYESQLQGLVTDIFETS
jgi:biotin carboxylase